MFYAHLVDHVGEEAAEAVLAQFPARDLDEPATKDFVALQIADLRRELHAEIATVRIDMEQGFARLQERIDRQTERLMVRVQLMAGVLLVAMTLLSLVGR